MNKDTRYPTCHKQGRNKPVSEWQQVSMKFSSESVRVGSLIRHPSHGIACYDGLCKHSHCQSVTCVKLVFSDGISYIPEEMSGVLEVLAGTARITPMQTKCPKRFNLDYRSYTNAVL